MSNANVWNYATSSDGVVERTVYIKAKRIGKSIKISHLTDMHLNYCNEKDFEENDPVLMSTYEHREWLKNRASLDNAITSLSHTEGSDAIVVTGDILDYLSYGCAELAKKYIFTPYPNLMASLGNHETARKVQGKLAETMPFEEKEMRLSELWCNELYYSSKIIDDRVMIIQMDNCSHGDCFYEYQVEPFKRDIEIAREKEYNVLLFFHINIATKNPADISVNADMVGDPICKNMNLSEKGIKEESGEASRKICEIIRGNADLIDACFCGHLHCDLYCQIEAKTKSGKEKSIPQYILMGTPYGKGHILNIIIE